MKEKQNFERVVVSKDKALEMFQENKFKVEHIGNLPDDAVITAYRCDALAHHSAHPVTLHLQTWSVTMAQLGSHMQPWYAWCL